MKFKWTKIEQDAFKSIKLFVACDDLLAYPYFNEESKIHTDASNFQLGDRLFSGKVNRLLSVVEKLLMPRWVIQ